MYTLKVNVSQEELAHMIWQVQQAGGVIVGMDVVPGDGPTPISQDLPPVPRKTRTSAGRKMKPRTDELFKQGTNWLDEDMAIMEEYVHRYKKIAQFRAYVPELMKRLGRSDESIMARRWFIITGDGARQIPMEYH